MKLTGVMLDNVVWESSRRVTEAIVTPDRIATHFNNDFILGRQLVARWR